MTATALRETKEEIHVDRVEPLGEFMEMPSIRGQKVTAIVGHLGTIHLSKMTWNQDEVDLVFAMRLDELYTTEWEEFRGLNHRIPSWNVPPHKVNGIPGVRIWGLTAFILNEFLKNVIQLHPTNKL